MEESTMIITLNDPKTLNILSHSCMQLLIDKFSEARDNDNINTIIFNANGKNFSAGIKLE